MTSIVPSRSLVVMDREAIEFRFGSGERDSQTKEVFVGENRKYRKGNIERLQRRCRVFDLCLLFCGTGDHGKK